MTFWQENYGFIKDVYDTRSAKLVELMDKTDASIKAGAPLEYHIDGF